MLSDFYRSKDWESLIQIIRAERTSDDGLVYCEHCGKPIVRKYDCIAHHIDELTEDNYMIADVSLNPDNIMLIHHKCHNKIHNKLGHSERNVYLVYGSPFSGKTTWVNDVRSDGDMIVDVDSIWECVSGERYSKDKRLNAVVFNVRDSLINMIKMRTGYWRNAYIIGGYPLSNERERMCRMLGAREIFIDTSCEECMARLERCDDSRDKEQWAGYISEWFGRYTPRG